MNLLTKSKYINGQQCPRLLWHADRKKLPKISIADQHRFDQGFEFEKVARKLFLNGNDLSQLGFIENINKTKELVQEKSYLDKAKINVHVSGSIHEIDKKIKDLKFCEECGASLKSNSKFCGECGKKH